MAGRKRHTDVPFFSSLQVKYALSYLAVLAAVLLCVEIGYGAEIEIPAEVTDAVPPEASALLDGAEGAAQEGTLWTGIGRLCRSACAYVRTALESQASGAAVLLGIVLLCSMAESCFAAADAPGAAHGVAGQAPARVKGQAEAMDGLAQQQGGQDGDQIGGGKEEQMAEFHPPCKPEGAPQGDEEDGLELEGEGHRQQHHRPARPLPHGVGHGVEHQRGIQGVALPPERAVEYHRRQQKKQAEAEQAAQN